MPKSHELIIRQVKIPSNRSTAIRNQWKEICKVLVDNLDLECQLNTKKGVVMLRSPTNNESMTEKGVDFIDALCKGFQFEDALAMVRMDCIQIQTVHMKNVTRQLKGDHLSRGIGRIIGSNGTMKAKLENGTRTRIVIQGTTAHIMGASKCVEICRQQISKLAKGAKINVISGRLGDIKRACDSF